VRKSILNISIDNFINEEKYQKIQKRSYTAQKSLHDVELMGHQNNSDVATNHNNSHDEIA